MLNRHLTSSVLAAALIALPMTFVGCDQNASTTANTPTRGPGETAGRAVDNAGRNAADAANTAANDAKAGASDTWRAANNGANNAANAANNAANDTANAARNAGNNAANAANNAANNANTAANNAANNANNAANNSSTSNVPGMPSVNGTSTSGMSTADAAAQRLIDNAHNNISQKDYSKAKTLLSELKDKGMYDSLSAGQKAKVDSLEKEINSAATAQENK